MFLIIYHIFAIIHLFGAVQNLYGALFMEKFETRCYIKSN